MYSSVEMITPQRAVEILDTKNFNNRAISQMTVDRYAQEMKARRWKLNGEPVIFGKSGRLIDGQHRLKACIQANVTFDTLVVKGADDDVFDTVDDGRVRSLGDVLHIRGDLNSNALAAGLRFIWDYGTGRFHGDITNRKNDVLPSKQLLEHLLSKHPGVRRSNKLFSMLCGRAGGMLLPPSLAIGLHYLFSLTNDEKADSFFTSVQSGLELKAGDPILLLRTRLIASARDKVNKITRESQYAYTVFSWNAYVQDKQLKNYFYKPAEALPEIYGLSRELASQLLDW